MLQITVDMFSGRPNPTSVVTDDAEARAILRDLARERGLLTESVNLESFISNKLFFFESENRLAGMFSTLAGTVFGSAEAKPRNSDEPEESELREDLERDRRRARARRPAPPRDLRERR